MPRLIARTADWLVLAKEPGWLTIPGRDPSSVAPVLSQWVKEQEPESYIVHRLDRETSGVILFALNRDAHRQANRWFSKHEVRKTYECLALGKMSQPVHKISSAIEGAACVTQVERLEAYAGAFLGRVRPLTGRRHQIRIHLARQGHALLGDFEYEGPRRFRLQASGRDLEIGRVALHAAKLELPNGEKFEAEWPEDFTSWVAAFRDEGTPS